MKKRKPFWPIQLVLGAGLHWFHWTIVLASLLLTLSASYITHRQISNQNQARFDYQAQQIIRQVGERMKYYEETLWSGVAALSVLSSKANRDDWRAFANTLKIDQRFPGVNGIGVIHYIEADQLDGYLAWQKKLMPEFQLRPASIQDDYWPVSYVEPEESNAQAIGLDMSHEHNRYQAALASRASGTAQITGPIQLVQDANKTPGFLFYTPWYESSDQPDEIAVQSTFLGLVYAPFIVYKLMDGTLANANRQVHFSIQDAGETLYSELSPTSAEFDHSPLFRTTETLELYGRHWRFQVQSSLIFREQHQNHQPILILAGGILVDGFLLALFIMLANSNRRASLKAQEATKELVDQTHQLKQNAMRLDGAMNAMMDGLLLIDEFGVIQTLNDAALKMFGYSRQDLVGTKVNQLMDDKEAEQHDGYLARKTPEADNPMLGKERKLMAKRSDGSLFPIRLNVSKGIIDGQVFYTGIIHDLSRLNESQLQLQKSEKLLQVALHTSGTATCIADIRGNFIEANTAFCDWLGYRYEELLDKSVADLVSDTHREQARQGIFALIKRESLSITQQKQYKHKSGKLVWGLATVTRLDIENDAPVLFAQVTNIQPLKDLSDQLDTQNRQLTEANKELRQFNYIASHDLKEPLRTLRTFTGYLLRDLESQKTERIREDIHYIQDSADRMTRLINDLLGLSRAGYDRIAAVEFTSNEVISESLRNLTAQIEESGAEVLQTGPELELQGDKGLIVQAIQNLIANAIKFHQIETAPQVEIISEETPDSKIIGVRDNGIGIAEENQGSIFLAFKRLHGMGEYEGSGIGLSIVKKILDRHNASIRVASTLGEGSYFQIEFPN